MDLDLTGKAALVTGSTAGIGLAIARGLAGQGAGVTITGRTPQRVEAALGQLREALPQALVRGIVADLGTAEGAETVTRALPAADILVNNLGIYDTKPFQDIADAEWLRFFEINVLSGIRMTRHYLPGMRDGDWGRIVFISSESAQQIPADMIHYGMTKTAQLAVARGVAETLVGSGVTVNSVLAGPTLTEAVEDWIRSDGDGTRGLAEAERDFFVRERPSSLIRRFARPEEAANLVVYLCSPAASATHGAALRADGGVVRSIL